MWLLFQVTLTRHGTELVRSVHTRLILWEDPIKISLSFLFLLLFQESQALAESPTISLKDHVLVMLSFDPALAPHAVSAVVEQLDMDGKVHVSFEFLQDGTFQSAQDVVSLTSVIKEVPTFQGLRTKDIVCLSHPSRWGPKGTSVRIDHLFPNGAAEVRSTEFFIQGFSIFRKREVVNIKALQSCTLKSSVKSNGSHQ